MYILNHSCKVEQNIREAFIDWLNAYYGETDKEGVALHDYRYSQLCAPQEDDGTIVMIIQLFLEEINTDCEAYLQSQQLAFQSALFQKFNGKALSFLTLMKVLNKNEK